MSRPLFRLACVVLMACGLLAAFGSRSWAKPRSIGFAKIVDGAEVIAVARFVGEQEPTREDHHVELELTRVLKGDLKPGTYRVTFSDQPEIPDGTREFVAFLGKGLCWRFAAQPISGENRVGDGVLQVEGFYDSNAYWVLPGLATLGRIETYLKDHTLTYTIRGPLYFPKRGQVEWEPSTTQIEVRYDAMTGRATVLGLPELKGFPTHPVVYVGSAGDNDVVVAYSRGTDTPLVIQGQVQSANPGGEMRARFFVAEPDVLTREAFEDYVADPSKGHSYYTIKVACAPFGGEEKPRQVSVVWHEERGRMGVLEGWSDGRLRLTSFGSNIRGDALLTCHATAELRSGEELALRFQCGQVDKGADVFPRPFQAELLYRLWAGEVPGRVLIRDGTGEREVTTFTASLGEVRYAKLDRPRTERPWLMVDEVESRPEAEYEGAEAFECGTSEQADVPPGGQRRLLLWAGVAVAILLTAVIGWRVWRRRKVVPDPDRA
jgi:hypothetical protein